MLLLARISLGDEDEAMALCQEGEGLGDAGEQLDGLIGDGSREARDALPLLSEGGASESSAKQSSRERSKLAIPYPCAQRCVFTTV